MRLFLSTIALLLLEVCCGAAPRIDSLPVGKPLPATIKRMHEEASLRLADGHLAPVTFTYSYEVLVGHRFAAVNRAIRRKIWPEGGLSKSIQSWGKYFGARDGSDSEADGYHNVSERIGFVSDAGVSFFLETDECMGQAHPYHEVRAYWVDLSGDFHVVQDVIGSERLRQITPLAEEAFRRKEELSRDANISQSGFFAATGDFSLSRNILIEGPRKLLMLYNDYEVGPYSAGSPRVAVAW